MNKPISAKAKRMLKAVLELREYYKGGYEGGPLARCPLCDACSHDCEGECPWYLLMKLTGCGRTPHIADIRRHPPAPWRASSIKRLTLWARLIRNGTYDRKLKGAK